ncbi:MAG: ABC transporter permease [Candidatus Marinamargulisbacteria bacterium]|nr:ABC transporter permease [Candidatus Marinamargulisbacteria bacterium]|tara:strand:- start:616 stop:1836 length:1221 start_codon:yes stop_codon:yes gene_type:complete
MIRQPLPYSIQLSLTYLWSRASHSFIRIVTAISIAGIALSVAAIVVIMAIMDGFAHTLKQQLTGLHADIQIEHIHTIDPAHSTLASLSDLVGIDAITPTLTVAGFMQPPDPPVFISISGIDFEQDPNVTTLANQLDSGHWPAKPNHILIGRSLANHHGLLLGSTVRIHSPNHPQPLVRTVVGIVHTGIQRLDTGHLFTNIATAQALSGVPNRVHQLKVRIAPHADLHTVHASVRDSLPDAYWVTHWMSINPVALRALRLEHTVMMLIVSLILLMAIGNMGTTLLIHVLDKTHSIGILRALGARPAFIHRVFIIHGLLVTTIGLIIGLFIGIVISYYINPILAVVDQFTGIHLLPDGIYYLDHIPVQFNALGYGLVAMSAWCTTILCAWYPAKKAADLDPVAAVSHG